MKTISFYTDKEYKCDSDGFCKVYVAHIMKGDNYSIHECGDLDRMRVFIKKFRLHNFDKNTHVQVECCRCCNFGKRFITLPINYLSF